MGHARQEDCVAQRSDKKPYAYPEKNANHDTLSIITDKLLAKLVDGRTDGLAVAYTALVYLNLRVAYI